MKLEGGTQQHNGAHAHGVTAGHVVLTGETQTARAAISRFAEDTNTHGIHGIQRSSGIRRFCWILLVLGGTGLTTWQVTSVFINYFMFPANVHISIDSSSALPFPAVSICNTNQIRKSQLPALQPLLGEILPYSYGKNATIHLESSVARAAVRQALDRKWAIVDENIKMAAGHQKETMILDCAVDGQKCGPQNFTAYYNSLYGNCYAINTGWTGEPLIKSHKPGPATGLELELFLEQEEYVIELTETAGIRLLVHLQDEMPFPEDGAVLLPPGFMTVLSMRMTNITRLPYPYPSMCWDFEPSQAKKHTVYSEIYSNVEYSPQACYKTCYQAHVIGACGCGDPVLPLVGAAVMHLSNKTGNIKPCTTLAEITCEEDLKQRAKEQLIDCNCSASCTDVIFKFAGSQAEWPNNGLRDLYHNLLLQRNPHVSHIVNGSLTPTPRESFLKVQLYYQELNREIIVEQPAYTVMTLFGDVGGVIGLYMGLSVVAFFELLELIYDLLAVCCRQGHIKVTQGSKTS